MTKLQRLAGYAVDAAQGASNGVTSMATAPVDGIAWLLRKAGMPMPEQPIGGSAWAANLGLTVEPKNKLAGLLGESIGGVTPMLVGANAARIGAGVLQAAKNVGVAPTLSPQAGMLRLPGRGQIPETRNDVNKLADRLEALLDQANVKYVADKSSMSPARYVTIDNHSQPTAQVLEHGADPFKIRISDHRNVHGADISVDKVTGTTFEEMMAQLKAQGVPIANRLSPPPKGSIPDDILENILGVKLDTLAPGVAEIFKSRYVYSPKGYWTEKK